MPASDVRSDLRVTVEGAPAAESRSSLQSRVALVLRRPIRQQVSDVLARSWRQSCRVSIVDEGALPFVIAARVEAAVKRAGLGDGRSALPDQVPLPAAFGARSSASLASLSARQRAKVLRQRRIARTRRGHPRPRRLGAPLRERRCAPAGSQRAASRGFRRMPSAWCASTSCRSDWPISKKSFRNRPTSSSFPRSKPPRRLPKSTQAITRITRPARRHPADLADADSRIGARHRERLRHRNGLRPHRRAHHRPGGLHRRPRRGEDSRRATSRSMPVSAWSMRRMRAASRRSIRSSATSPTWTACCAGAKLSRAMGFEGMGCIHPMQIEVIHRGIRAFAAEIEKALKIVAAYEDAQAEGLGVVSLGSKMIDAPGRQPRRQAGGARPANGPDPDDRRRPGMSTLTAADLVVNAAGRRVPDRRQWSRADSLRSAWTAIAPPATSAARRFAATPTIRANGDKRVPDLETALRLCGLRDGMTISSHHHLRNGDRVALTALANRRAHGRQGPHVVPQRVVSLP